jgi:hypothetical protein
VPAYRAFFIGRSREIRPQGWTDAGGFGILNDQMARLASIAGAVRGGDSRAGRFRLLYRGEELVLEPGQYLIGRSPGSDIVVDDALASRRHARILANDTTVLLEDLRSENGVFVNEQRIRRSVRLQDGDRILVGKQELAFRVLPPNVMEKMWSGQRPRVSDSVPPPVPFLPTSAEGASTLESDAFAYLGQLADKMLALGRPKTAERMLGGHLWDVLQAARRGERVERPLMDAASTYAMKLAVALRDAGWVHYVIELHVIFGLPVCNAAGAMMRKLLPQLPTVNRSLFNGYQRALLAMLDRLPPEDVLLARQVLAITIA